MTNICENIECFINNLEELKKIGLNGKEKIQNYFNLEKQQSDRLKFINKFIDLDYNEEENNY